jgi:hypothetical protein
MANRRERETRELRYADTREFLEKEEGGFRSKAWKAPPGVGVFRFRREGIYEIDVIPYITQGRNPRQPQPGLVYWEYTFAAHTNVGPDRDTYNCLRRMFNAPCPACELAAEIGADPKATKDEKNFFRDKTRRLMCFWVRNAPTRDEISDELKLFESGVPKAFGELLSNELDYFFKKDVRHPKLQFFRPDEKGFTLSINVKEDTWAGGKYMKPVRIEFEPRRDPLPDDILDRAPVLEDLFVEHDYDDFKGLLHNGVAANGMSKVSSRDVRSDANGAARDDRRRDDRDDDRRRDRDREPERVRSRDDFHADPPRDRDDPTRGDDETGAADDVPAIGDEVEHEDYGVCTVKSVKDDVVKLTDAKGRLRTATLDEIKAVGAAVGGDDPEDPGDLSVGDSVEHEDFGVCEVVEVRDEIVKIKTEAGKVKTAEPSELTPAKKAKPARPTSALAAGSTPASAGASRSDPDDDEPGDEPEPPKKGRKAAPVTAQDKGLKTAYKVDHPKFGICTIVHVSADGTSLKVKDVDGVVHSAVRPEDVEKHAAASPAARRKADDDEDAPKARPARRGPDDDDDEDDEPENKRPRKGA